MEISCPFSMYKGKIDGYLVSKPINVTKTTRGRVEMLDSMNILVCIKDQTRKTGATCVSPEHINCNTFNK